MQPSFASGRPGPPRVALCPGGRCPGGRRGRLAACRAQAPRKLQHGEHAPVLVAAVGQAELREDARDVLLRAAQRDPQRGRRSPGSSSPSATSCEHLALARRQAAPAAPSARSRGEQPETTCGSSAVPPLDDAAQRRDEVLDVGHAVLEQVAEPLGMLGEHPRRDARLDVLGEDHDRDPRDGARGSRARREALVGVRRRHADVDDRDVGRVLVDGAQQLLGVVGLGGDLEPALAQQRRRSPRARAGCRRRSRRARQLRGHGRARARRG